MTNRLIMLKNNNKFISFLLNTLFLLFFLLYLTPSFETNDDFTMAAILEGAYGQPSPHLIFINIFLGKILKAFVILIPGIKWYVVAQFFLIYISFCVMSYIFLQKQGSAGYFIAITMLIFFGYECYVNLQFTKTAGIAAIAGTSLLFYYFENQHRHFRTLILGIFLVISGSFYRFAACIMVLIFMGILGIKQLNELRRNDAVRQKYYCRYILTWTFVIISILILKQLDSYYYNSRPEWKEYREYNQKRAAVLDYGVPSYNDHSNEYDKIGLSRNDVFCLYNWTFQDPHVFTADTFQEILDIKKPPKITPSFLKEFFKIIPAFFLKESCSIAVAAIFLLWLFGSKKYLYCVCYLSAVFISFNFYFFFQGRYLQHRVDIIVLMAIFTVFSFLIDFNLHLGRKKIAFIPLLTAGLFTSVSFCRDNYLLKLNKQAAFQNVKSAYDTIANDKEHIYFEDTLSSQQFHAYGIGYIFPPARYQNLVSLGEWTTKMPEIQNILKTWDAEVPFEFLINNPDAFLIDNRNPQLKLVFIQEHYNESAQLEFVKHVGDLNVYKITAEE